MERLSFLVFSVCFGNLISLEEVCLGEKKRKEPLWGGDGVGSRTERGGSKASRGEVGGAPPVALVSHSVQRAGHQSGPPDIQGGPHLRKALHQSCSPAALNKGTSSGPTVEPSREAPCTQSWALSHDVEEVTRDKWGDVPTSWREGE